MKISETKYCKCKVPDPVEVWIAGTKCIVCHSCHCEIEPVSVCTQHAAHDAFNVDSATPTIVNNSNDLDDSPLFDWDLLDSNWYLIAVAISEQSFVIKKRRNTEIQDVK